MNPISEQMYKNYFKADEAIQARIRFIVKKIHEITGEDQAQYYSLGNFVSWDQSWTHNEEDCMLVAYFNRGGDSNFETYFPYTYLFSDDFIEIEKQKVEMIRIEKDVRMAIAKRKRDIQERQDYERLKAKFENS